MAPARLDKGQAVVGDQRRHGAAQEIGRRHKIRIEDGDIGRVRVAETESEIARLEAFAVAAAQQLKVDAFRHQANKAGRQRCVVFFRAVIQKLDRQAVARPVQCTGCCRNTQGEIAFVADRQLHQHVRKIGIGKLRHRHLGRGTGHPYPGQHRQLDRQRADGDQDEGEEEGEDIAEHGEGSGPQGFFLPGLTQPIPGRAQFRHLDGPPAGCAATHPPTFLCPATISKGA